MGVAVSNTKFDSASLTFVIGTLAQGIEDLNWWTNHLLNALP